MAIISSYRVLVVLLLFLLGGISGCAHTPQSSAAAQSRPAKALESRPGVQLPLETAGLGNIVQTLVSTFDHTDILALSDNHWRKWDSDLRIALVRHPKFPTKAHFIVVEFASTAEQPVLDRYIRGEDVPLAELQQVWKTTTQTNAVWTSPVYADFFAAVREVNKKLPANQQIRVLAGDPPAGTNLRLRDTSAITVLKEQVLEKDGKALLIYGSGHLNRIGGITKSIDSLYPGRIFVVDSVGGIDPQYQQFEVALKSSLRPVLVSLHRTPFQSFSADTFFGSSMKLVNGVWVPAHEYQAFNLGQMADACVYLGMTPEATARVSPIP